MLNRLYPYRFELFFFSQIAILFGSLIIPDVASAILLPLLFLINLVAGIVLVSKKPKRMWFLTILLIVSTVIFGSSVIENIDKKLFSFLKMGTYFLYYIVVTYEIITQVWQTARVNKKVILGLISGYVSLGLIGFFICISIEMAYPQSFQGLLNLETNPNALTEGLMYYSYITLLTIGYGDILPVTPLAQKAAILIGMTGQFYLVIITAVVVGKHINQKTDVSNE